MGQLDDTAKAANVVGSIQAYFQNELADVLNSSAPAIDYGGGMPFADAALAEWLQPRVLGPVRPEALAGPFAGRAGHAGMLDARGQELYWLLNVNAFVRPARLAAFTNLRAWQLRDLVLAALAVGTRIPVRDWADATAAGGETLGYLFVDAVPEDRAVADPLREDLIQHNLVFRLRWTETWSVE